jgi:hypothetical protein
VEGEHEIGGKALDIPLDGLVKRFDFDSIELRQVSI